MEPNGHRKWRRRDPSVRQNSDVNLSNAADELDPWTAWAYRPHTISLLLVGACFLIWVSGALDPENSSSGDLVTSVKRGVLAMIAVFLAYCLLQAPSTHWNSNYPLEEMSFFHRRDEIEEKRDDARQFMKFLHPDLGVELPERSYGADCRIYVPENPTSRFKNVYETLFDEFVLAHIFGWWGKAIMIRNQPLLWVLSVGFELMELTFRHMLPNFNECWWDSIILDILICNWFGEIPYTVFLVHALFNYSIWAGMHTVRYFDGRTYEWVGISRQPNIIGKVKRTLGQFTPAQWDKDEWHPLLGPWRFIQVLSLCIVFLTVELNTFFLKFCLWIPPQNPVIVYRLILWWLIAIPTIHTLLTDIHDPMVFTATRPISQSNASMVDNLLGICRGGPCDIPDRVVMATASNFGEKETIILPLWTDLNSVFRRKAKRGFEAGIALSRVKY
ncbi:hypothetical protein HHK36_006874 [Tetracentron sinense]|uniref:CDP-diacylglycerol--serine O-phosphatidyltransferase n=1 Tax=Tetracentron sinense TaxID=13715 RepID=A0A834ZIA1_TETSI|nr:hypothetical protein HHK36_006874 [Tetracentron sinense]